MGIAPDLDWLDQPLPFPAFGVGEVVVGVVKVRRRHYVALAAVVDALAGRRSLVACFQVYLTPEERLAALRQVAEAAVGDDVTVEVLEDALAGLVAGPPPVPFTTVADEARWWVEVASEAERKQYLLACFRSLSRAERVRFLAAAQKAALA